MRNPIKNDNNGLRSINRYYKEKNGKVKPFIERNIPEANMLINHHPDYCFTGGGNENVTTNVYNPPLEFNLVVGSRR